MPASWTTIAVGGGEMEAYVASPASDGPHPAVIVVQEIWGVNGYIQSIGNRLAADLQERLFDELDHEIIRVSGTESAPTVSRVLEAAALANIDDVITGLHQVMGGTT